MKIGADELVTGAEAARRLGISRERLRQLAERDDFPTALGRAGVAVLWRWADVEAWARKSGRTVAVPSPDRARA